MKKAQHRTEPAAAGAALAAFATPLGQSPDETSKTPPPRNPAPPVTQHEASGERRTRTLVVDYLLSDGPLSATELAARLGLSPAGVRRHLDALLNQGRITANEPAPVGATSKGRGRPAKTYSLTEAGRAVFPHAYDDLAASALRSVAQLGGAQAVEDFANQQIADLEERCRSVLDDAGDDPLARAEALALALSREGYAASASVIASGGQLCQHHCPVSHVAAEFPALCEAETQAIGRLVGSHVQRLATIAHGDGVCTTHIPGSAQSGHSAQPRSARGPTPNAATARKTSSTIATERTSA